MKATNNPLKKRSDYNHPNRISAAVFKNGKWYSVSVQKHYLDKESGEYRLAGGFSIGKQDALSLAKLLNEAYSDVVALENESTLKNQETMELGNAANS